MRLRYYAVILLALMLAACAPGLAQPATSPPTNVVLSAPTPVPPTEAPPSPTATVPVAANLLETIQIVSPLAGAVIEGGTLVVTGFSEYFFESNLAVALCGAGGDGEIHPVCGTQDNVLALGYATIAAPDIGLPGPFSGTLQYTVTAETPARLTVYAISPRDGGILHLSTVILTVRP